MKVGERMRIHEYLDIVKKGQHEFTVVCRECGTEICDASENYKLHVPYAVRDPAELGYRYVRKEWNVYREYYCPKCATLLQTDVVNPKEPEQDLRDIEVFIDRL